LGHFKCKVQPTGIPDKLAATSTNGYLDVVWQCRLLISCLDRLLDAWSQLVEIHSCTELIFTIPGIMKIQTVHSMPSNWQFIATSFPHEPFKDNIITTVLLMFNI